MYVSRIAFRHANGEVEGFIGTGFSPEAAEQNADQGIRNKLWSINSPTYSRSRIIRSADGLTPDELATIRRDWLTYHAKGSSILPLPRKGAAPAVFC